jgi:hypothetical protein
MSDFDFGLGINIDESQLSSDEDDKAANPQEIIQNQQVNFKTKEDLKARFELLRSKRLTREARQKRRSQKRLERHETKNAVAESTPAHPAPSVCEIFKAPLLKEDLRTINRLTRDIDEALKKDQIELAEKISDDLANKQSELSLSKAAKAAEYKAGVEAKKKKKNEKKKKLFWRFEPKQHWESKANM